MSFFTHSVQMIFWRSITIVLGAATAVLLARFLGPEDRGVLAILVFSVTLATLVVQLGFPEAIIYVTGAKLFPDDEVISTIAIYFLGVIAFASLPCYFLLTHFFKYSQIQSILLIIAGSASVLLTTMRHFLLAFKRFTSYSGSIVLEGSIYLAGIALLWGISKLSVESALMAYCVSLVTALFVLITRQFRLDDLFSPKKVRPEIIGKCFSHGIFLFITGIGGFGSQRINYFLLESLAGARVVGLFAAASTVPSLFANLPQQLGTVLYAHVSSSQSEENGMQLTVLVVKALAVISFILIMPVAFFSEQLSLLIFGAEYAGIGKTLVILSAGMILTGLGSVLYNALAGVGLHRFGSHMTVINLSVVSLLAYLLIPVMGLEGAAWAQFMASLLSFVFVSLVFCKKYQLSMTQFLSLSRPELP